VAGRLSLAEALLRHAYGLIGKSLQPHYPSQEDPSLEAQVGAEADEILKAGDIPSRIAHGILRQHLLQAASRTHLIADIVLGYSHQVLTEQPIVQIWLTHRQVMKSLRKWQRRAEPAAPGVVNIQTSQGAELVIAVAEVLG
jgi:hypothetical protein